MQNLPAHLNKFIVDQNQRPYTSRDHAVWRYILRQLKTFLSKNAHPFYVEGLRKTGITVDSIPQIESISERLSNFGWQAKPVSGFIPPAAFMELQALSILPIARDMRSIEHLLYTPAPDIVHEAAGHAPMVAHPEFAQYLKDYAQVAKRAIISSEDMAVYEAIRLLSDVKENPQSSPEEIQATENKLQKAIDSITHVSEATLLSRMNWWTAEYGLIGTLDNPKIYGAGLLSSVGEARWCLSDKVKKLPLTLDCINYTYDITEPQPQLFVTPDFKTLSKVLQELAETMAYKRGGSESLDKAARAKTINTVELNSGLQMSGQVVEYIKDSKGQIAFVRLNGPSQLSLNEKQIPKHNKEYHSHGYSTPVGKFKMFPDKCPSELTESEWKKMGINLNQKSTIKLEYTSGFEVKGDLVSHLSENGKTILLTLEKATATFEGRVLFEPAWGTYDIALGCKVVSVFGGPADRLAYGQTDDFVVARVPEVKYKESDMKLFAYYQILRDVREGKKTLYDLESSLQFMSQEFPDEWLLFLEALEISIKSQNKKLADLCRQALEKVNKTESAQQCIQEGIAIADQFHI